MLSGEEVVIGVVSQFPAPIPRIHILMAASPHTLR